MLVDIASTRAAASRTRRPTTHADPTYRVHGSVFYCVANMPGAVPHTSTYALTNATLPYVLRLADLGWEAALAADPALAAGLSTHRGALHSLAGRARPRPALHGAGRAAGRVTRAGRAAVVTGC